jgi:hypothetical protein
MRASTHPRQRLSRASPHMRADCAIAELLARFLAPDLNGGEKQQLGIQSVEENHVQVDVEVQCTDEALGQRHRAGPGRLAGDPRLFGALPRTALAASATLIPTHR